MTLSTTGLAVTGALSSTGDTTVGAAAAGTNRTLNINGVVSKASRIAFQESGVDRWLIGNGAASENGNFEIYDATNGNNVIFTRTGNVGIGVTPSASDTTYKSIELGRIGNTIAGYNGGTEVNIAANAYYSAGWKYAVSTAATRYMTDNSGAHIWYNSASGTAGNAITFTQAMTLNGNSNLTLSTGTRHQFTTASNQGVALQLISTYTNGRNWGIGSNFVVGNGELAIYDYTANTTRMLIDSSGNVGIGTLSPTAKLHVDSGTQKLVKSVTVNSSTQTIVTNSTEGVSGLCWIRNASVGGQALVLWDISFGVTIVSQLGSVFTTSSPSATQIQLSTGGSSPYYVQAIAGATRNGDSLSVSAINNQ
jgi:hypothetical protein